MAAGVYRAFFLSSFQPVVVLKSKLSTGFKGGGLRNALVVVQFSIAVFLIAGTLVIYKQLHFIQTKNLGYSRDQVLDFIKPVALAFAVAAPVAFISMQRWLEGFAFRTTISWWVIPAAGLAAFIIALVTISFQSMNAALANPVDSLKEQ